MSKSSKNKKNKVPKITEEEYAAYVTALKAERRVSPENNAEAQKCESEKGKEEIL